MVMVAINYGFSNEPMLARPTGRMVGAATLDPPTSGQALCGGDTRPAASYRKALVGPTWENKPSRGANTVVVLLHVPEHDPKDTYKGEQEAVTPVNRKVITSLGLDQPAMLWIQCKEVYTLQRNSARRALDAHCT